MTSSSKQHNQTTESQKKPTIPKNTTKCPIWEVVVEIGEQIPDEEWAKIPSDASINYKHYLYGTPKKTHEDCPKSKI